MEFERQIKVSLDEKIQKKKCFRCSKLIFNYVCAGVSVCESLLGWPLINTALNASLN